MSILEDIYNAQSINKETIRDDKNEIVIDRNIIEYLENNLEVIQKEIGSESIAAAAQGYLEDFMVKYVNQ